MEQLRIQALSSSCLALGDFYFENRKIALLLKLLFESLFFVLYPHQGKDAVVLLLPSTQAYVGLRVGVERHVFLACIAESKTRSEQK